MALSLRQSYRQSGRIKSWSSCQGSDPQQAERVLGGTAQLEFRQQKPGTEAQLFVEQQVRQELQPGSVEKTGDTAAIEKNQEALKK